MQMVHWIKSWRENVDLGQIYIAFNAVCNETVIVIPKTSILGDLVAEILWLESSLAPVNVTETAILGNN